MEILQSSFLGNSIGILSLIVGIIGVIITVKTMKSAKRIEADIKVAQINALDKKRFHNFKEVALKKLTSKRNAARKEKIISFGLCDDVIAIINDLKGYKNIISKEDIDIAEKSRNELQKMVLSLQDTKSTSDKVLDFDRIVADVMNILNKGEYEL